MRDLPLDLQEKINKKHQTIYENANPQLKVLLSRGFNKELFRVYTIHEKILITDIDVTAKKKIDNEWGDDWWVMKILPV